MDPDDFLYTLDEMLEDERFSFASETLEGIKKTVTRTRVVTEGQASAVKNIGRSERDKQAKTWTRRYEGMR
jgi:hypothetical protein